MNIVHVIATIIAAEPGFVVSMVGLNVFRCEDGSYSVTYEDDVSEYFLNLSFDTPGDAARKFLELREEKEIGFDYQVDSAKAPVSSV